MAGKQKLELTWIGKDQVAKLEPRILIEDTGLSYHAQKRHGETDIFNNKLIFGDNLLALKALETEYAGEVKCVFIDPPYNTGAAFKQFGYEDGIEHSIWLNLMKARLVSLKRLLKDDGTIWIAIDDTEAHYLKVLCDEVFGRNNFVANVIWQKKSAPANDARWISDNHDHILVYAKNKDLWRPNKLERTDAQNAIYKNSDEYDGVDASGNYYGRGPWFADNMTVKTLSESGLYEIQTPSGRTVMPADGRAWVYTKSKFEELLADNRITFGKSGANKPCIKRFFTEVEDSKIVPKSVWLYEEVGENRHARQEVKKFNSANPFATPKPEKLLERILHIATKQGDLVLDSFGGSGTTGAVAHKMGRRWVMVELENHCNTHIIPRLKQVIDGVDLGGATESQKWKGGGGFRYYKLAPSLLEKDKWGNWVINKDYDANMLAAAVCKHEGFTYSPSDSDWWAHGYSTETDFIYVTTQTLTEDQLVALSEEVGSDRTLLVCCAAYKASAAMLNDKLTNLTVKKMPNALLSKCEWGKDEYSLNITNLPAAEQEDEPAPAAKKKAASKEADLFGDTE